MPASSDQGRVVMAAPAGRSRYLANKGVRHAEERVPVDDLRAGRDRRWSSLMYLQGVTNLDRVGLCRKHRSFGAASAVVRLWSDGLARYGNVQTCGSVWACPVCTVVIRTRRTEQVREVGEAHVAVGGSLDFGSFTLPHNRTDSLAALLDAVRNAWKGVRSCRAYRRMSKSGEIVGALVAVEITHGYNGWHPHLHVLLFLSPGVDGTALRAAMDRAWADSVEAQGFRRPSAEFGVRWRPVFNAAALAEYLVKVQDGKACDPVGGIAAELLRGDAKRTRSKSPHYTPFQLLEIASKPGVNPASKRRAANALALWREYEQVTKGRRALTGLPPLLRRYLDVEDQADDVIAATDTASGPHVVSELELTDGELRAVVRYKHYRIRLLRDYERGGHEAAVQVLAVLGRRELYERRKAV